MISGTAERKTSLRQMAEWSENFTAYYRMPLNVCVALLFVGAITAVAMAVASDAIVVPARFWPMLSMLLVFWMMVGWGGHSLLLDDLSHSRMNRIFCGPYEQWLPQGVLASGVLGPIYFIAAVRVTW